MKKEEDEGDLICPTVGLKEALNLNDSQRKVISVLTSHSQNRKDKKKRNAIRRRALKLVWWENYLHERVKNYLDVVLEWSERENVLCTLHNNLGHGNANTTQAFIADKL